MARWKQYRFILDNVRERFNSYFGRRLCIYTDGGSKEQIGSWAYVIVRAGRIIEQRSGRVAKASSLTMEIRAAWEAIRTLPQNCKRAQIYSDCRILIDAIKGTPGTKLGGSTQFIQLQQASTALKLKWHWVKAHAGHPMNEYCDQLCIAARAKPKRKRW